MSTACMRRRADMYCIYKFKIVNNKEKPPTTGKLNQWRKQRQLSSYVHDIELHFTEKEKRIQTRKLNQKDVGL